MSQYQKESQVLRLLAFFRQNPGSTFSISYALLTLCGVYYSASFFNQFDIPILKLASASDMLLVGLSEPASLLMFFGGLGIAIFSDFITQISFDVHKRWVDKAESLLRSFVLVVTYTPKTTYSVMALFIFMFVLYSMIFVMQYGSWKGAKVKSGEGDKVLIYADNVAEKPLTFLGTTSTYVIVYDSEQSAAQVIPIEAISLMKPVLEKEEETKEAKP